MREIKFRAWDIEAESYVELGFDFRVDGNGNVYRRAWGETVWDRTTNLILEQFTDLKDKNGTDLDWWEDDLLRKGSDHPNAPIARISYNARKAQWVIVSESGGEFCGLLQAYENGWKKFDNVHQRQKLLEQDNASTNP